MISITRDKYDIPEIDYSLFEEGDQEALDCAKKNITDFLNGPYILTDFEDHNERRDWCSQLGIVGYMKINTLRTPFIGSAINSVRLFRRYFIGEDPEFYRLADAVIEQLEPLREEYDKLDNNEKVEFVSGVKVRIFPVLEYLRAER